MEHTLYKAAYKGDIKPIKEISDQQLNLIVTPNNNTILHVHITFCRRPSTRFVEEVHEICPLLLIQVNDNGDTPLHVAVKQGLVDMVEVLIKHAKAQHEDLEGNVTAIRQMLRMTNKDGNTALHEAAQNHNKVDVVKLLMKEDLDFPYDFGNHYGETPLYIAASRGCLNVVAEMLETCTATTYNYKGPYGMTILHAAVRKIHPDITRKILEKANENGWCLMKEKDENGWTPLHYAAYYGHLSIVKLLLRFDASAACIADNWRNMTALHLAAGQGYFKIARSIIDSCPACLEIVDDRGWNYLHFNMCSEFSPLTLRQGQRYWENCLLDAKDIRGNTPLLVLASVNYYMFDTMKKRVRMEFIESTNESIRNRVEQFRQLKNEVLELSNICAEPYKLDVIRFQHKTYIEHFDALKKHREMFLIVNALVATVTFSAGLNFPAGFIQEGRDKGTPVLIRNFSFQIFIILDAIAMALSVSAVLFQVFQQLNRFKKDDNICLHFGCELFTVLALATMVIAFLAGTSAMLAPSLGLASLVVFSVSAIFNGPFVLLVMKLIKSRSATFLKI